MSTETDTQPKTISGHDLKQRLLSQLAAVQALAEMMPDPVPAATGPTSVGAYLHGDMFTELKGLAACKISVNRDEFTARSKPAVAFARKVAMYGYGIGSTDFAEIAQAYPDILDLKASTEAELTAAGGKAIEITVLEIVVLK